MTNFKYKHPNIANVLMVLGVLMVLRIFGNAILETQTNEPSIETSFQSQTIESTKEPINYTMCDLTEMIKELDENALKAETKYMDMCIEITGNLGTIDSDGKYICIESKNQDFLWYSIQCYITDNIQTDKVMNMKKGDTITIKGRIISIGEVLGYSLDIEEIE